jgi:hypothetical protein
LSGSLLAIRLTTSTWSIDKMLIDQVVRPVQAVVGG